MVSFKDRYNIRVLNLSLGTDSTQDWRIDPLNYAVERAWAAGMTVVVAASNEGPGAGTITKPADDPWVVTVGATDDRGTAAVSDDQLPDFSGRGPTAHGLAKPDVAAPGAHVISLRAPGSTIDTQFPNYVDGSYRRGSGTSMATGVVSGAVALMLQANPGFTPDRVKHALAATARDAASTDPLAVGAGVVDANAAAFSAPAGLANQGLARSNGQGSLALSRGSVQVQTDDLLGSVLGPILGATLTAQLLLWNPGGYTGAPWVPSNWYLSTWEIHRWNRVSWYGNDWPGRKWRGSSWYGAGDRTSRTGRAWPGRPGTAPGSSVTMPGPAPQPDGEGARRRLPRPRAGDPAHRRPGRPRHRRRPAHREHGLGGRRCRPGHGRLLPGPARRGRLPDRSQFQCRDQGDAEDLFEAILAPAIFVLPPLTAVLVVGLAQALSEAPAAHPAGQGLLQRRPVDGRGRRRQHRAVHLRGRTAPSTRRNLCRAGRRHGCAMSVVNLIAPASAMLLVAGSAAARGGAGRPGARRSSAAR